MLLWRPGESPILTFVFAYQWLQIAADIFYAGWLGIDINQFSGFSSDMQAAAFLSLIGLSIFACGMRVGAGPVRVRDAELIRLTAQRRPKKDWFWLYMVAWLMAVVAQTFTWVIPGLTQPLVAFVGLKWAFFVMLTYVTFSRGDGDQTYWLIAFLLEFILSLGNYFSDFKTVFIYTLFGVVAAKARFRGRTYIGMALLAAIVLVIGIVWTAVKPDYRNFVNESAKKSEALSFDDEIAYLATLVANVDGTAMEQGLDTLIRRVGYLGYFGAAINYVPEVIPYQGGVIWLDAITRPFMPRLLFPDKSSIDDSARTTEYTGLRVSGAASGTSISIGYMGEAYIDFGPFGMMPVLVAFGYFLGRIYRYVLSAPRTRGILGMGLATAVIDVAAPFEQSITKTFGGVLVMLLVAVVVVPIVVRKFVPWLRT